MKCPPTVCALWPGFQSSLGPDGRVEEDEGPTREPEEGRMMEGVMTFRT